MNRRTAGNRIVLMTVLGLTVIVVGLILIRPLPQQNPSLEIRKKSLVILRNSLHEQDPYARSAAAKAMGDSNNPAVLSWLMAG